MRRSSVSCIEHVRAHPHHGQIDVDKLSRVFQRSRITGPFVVASPEQCLPARPSHQAAATRCRPGCSVGEADVCASSRKAIPQSFGDESESLTMPPDMTPIPRVEGTRFPERPPKRLESCSSSGALHKVSTHLSAVECRPSCRKACTAPASPSKKPNFG